MELPYSKRGPVFVYEILDARRVRYVGVAKNPYALTLQHLTGSSRLRICRWLRAAIASRRTWSVRIIGEFRNRDEAQRFKDVRAAVASAFGTILNTHFPGSDRGRFIHRRQFRDRKVYGEHRRTRRKALLLKSHR